MYLVFRILAKNKLFGSKLTSSDPDFIAKDGIF